MRINNWKHVRWFVFCCLATIAAWLLYAGNFHPDWMPPGIRLPPALIQTPTEHHTVGGTPLGLWFGAISLGIFVFAVGIPIVLTAAGITLGIIKILFGIAVLVIKLAVVIAIAYLILVGIRAVLR